MNSISSRVLSRKPALFVLIVLFTLIVIILSYQMITPASQQIDQLSWQSAPSVPRHRSQADWLIDMGRQSSEELFGSFPHQQYQIGDRDQFFPLSSSEHQTFVMRYKTSHAYFWFEPGFQVTVEELDEVARFFEEHIWTINTSILGNGTFQGRVHVINQKTIKSSIMGAFNPKDQCPRSLCPESNQRNIVYINLDLAPFSTSYYLSTLVHEHQHLVQFHQDGNDPHWFSEGIAQLVEHLCGFDIADFKTRHFLQRTDHRLHGWTFDGTDMSNYYGASFLFLLYLYEQFGPEFIQQVANTEYDGLAAVDNALSRTRQDMNIDDVFENWILANYLDKVVNSSEQYGYKTLDLPIHIDPKTLDLSVPDSIFTDSVHQYGTDYLRLGSPGIYDIRFSGNNEVAVISSTPPSGKWMWWSNNSRNGAARLTREIDLQELETATLAFHAWWDIDDERDWFHVLVSDDAGKSWQIVGGRRARGRNTEAPGKHYNGNSVVWVEEHIDLSEFAGSLVLVRFEYLTAGAEPSYGLALDNIGILEMSVFDDVEKPTTTWQPDGFVRISETVSQNWTVSIIYENPNQQPIVQHGELDAGNIGQMTIVVAPDDKVTLVIGAMAVFSQKRANYSIALQ